MTIIPNLNEPGANRRAAWQRAALNADVNLFSSLGRRLEKEMGLRTTFKAFTHPGSRENGVSPLFALSAIIIPSE